MSTENPTNQQTPQFHHHVTGEEFPGLPSPLPCPFCGDADVGGIVTRELNNAECPKSFHVQCDGCLGEGPPKDSIASAADAWNGTGIHSRKSKTAIEHVEAADKLRKEMDGANSVIGIVVQSMSWDDDHNRKRALQDAYDRFNKVVGQLDELGISISRSGVSHG